jgi:small subunit ribosomal protein S16
MPVKMRLQRKGRKKRPFYHIVIADGRAPRDGRFIEKVGIYNPMTVPATIELDRDKAYEWLTKGAQPTDTVRAILRFKGVLYKKHLMRGVKKGAMTAEEAETKFTEWVEAKESKIAARREKAVEEKAEFYAKLSGTPPVIKEEEVEIPAVEVETEGEEAAAAAEATEETAEATAEAPQEEAKAEEAPAEEAAKAEEPAAEEEASEEEK